MIRELKFYWFRFFIILMVFAGCSPEKDVDLESVYLYANSQINTNTFNFSKTIDTLSFVFKSDINQDIVDSKLSVFQDTSLVYETQYKIDYGNKHYRLEQQQNVLDKAEDLEIFSNQIAVSSIVDD